MTKPTEMWKLPKDALKRRSRTDRQKEEDKAKRREERAAKVAAWSPEERDAHNAKQRANWARRKAKQSLNTDT